MSPGFLSGALPHVGHQPCTENGSCRNPPLICPTSSCCTSNTNISFGTAQAYSQCGCWDSKRKNCKPLQGLQLGADICNSKNGILFKSFVEVASVQNAANFCKQNGPSVELEVAATTRTLRLQVTGNICLQNRGARQFRFILGPILFVKYTIYQTLGYRRDELRQILNDVVANKNLERNSIKQILEILSTYGDEKKSENKAIFCENPKSSSAIFMSPGFLPESVPNFLSQHSEVCGVRGECKTSNPACETTGCCLMSHDGVFGGCGCMNNSGNCLLDHKIFKLAGLACTSGGQRVEAGLVVNVPSNEASDCAEEDTSMKYSVNGAGNVEITVETTQCILAGVNGKFLEVETTLTVEVNADKFLKVIKQLY